MARSFSQPEMLYNDEKVFPGEIDQDQQYVIANPSIGTGWFGTVISASEAAIVSVNTRADYPRNVVLSIGGVAGGMGGTATINGKDQFGNSISETLGFATANAGGTVNGTKVFSEVTSGTVTPVGLGGTAVGTVALGVAIAGTPRFGLPARIGATSDLKRATWLDADTAKMLNLNSAGTSASAVVADSSVKLDVAGGMAAADSFVITYRSSFKNAEANQFTT